MKIVEKLKQLLDDLPNYSKSSKLLKHLPTEPINPFTNALVKGFQIKDLKNGGEVYIKTNKYVLDICKSGGFIKLLKDITLTFGLEYSDYNNKGVIDSYTSGYTIKYDFDMRKYGVIVFIDKYQYELKNYAICDELDNK